MVEFSCPKCGARVRANADLVGKVAPCPLCGERVQTPDEPQPEEPAANNPTGIDLAAIDEKIIRHPGIAIAVCGLIGLCYFGFMEVSVPREQEGGRIVNLALMQQQSNGLMLSGGAIGVGVIVEAIMRRK